MTDREELLCVKIMTCLHLEDLFFPGVVSLLAAAQLARFARRVGEARGRYKIPAPKTDGDPNFARIFRAQQNSLEFYPIFLTLLWISSIFFHNAAPSFFGIIYLYARHRYFYGYTQAPQGRLPGFRLAIKALTILLILSVTGVALTGYTKYTGNKVDVSFYQKKAFDLSKPVIDKVNASYNWVRNETAPYEKIAKANVNKFLVKAGEVTNDFILSVSKILFEVWAYMSEHFNNLKRNISTYFQTPVKQEL